MTPMSAVGPRGSRPTIRLNASTFLCAPFPPKHTFSLAVFYHRKPMKYCCENGECIGVFGILVLNEVIPTYSNWSSNTIICYVRIKILSWYYKFLIALSEKGRFKIYMSMYVKSKKSNYEYTKLQSGARFCFLTPKLDTSFLDSMYHIMFLAWNFKFLNLCNYFIFHSLSKMVIVVSK